MGQLSKIFSISFLIPFLCLTSCIERSPNYPPLDFVPQEGGGASLIFSGLPSAGIAGEELSSNLNVILEGLASADLSVKQTNSDATASNVNIALYRDSRCSIPVTLAPDGSPALIGYTPLPPINNRVGLPNLAITKAQSLYIQANYQGTLSSCTPISILPSSFSSTYGKLVFSSDIFDVGEPVSVTYTAFDAYGNRNPSGISASSISFSVLSGGGVFTPTVSLGDGVFASTFVSTSEGGSLVTVTSSSTPAISSPVAVQVVSGVPYSISVGGGNNQSGAAGSVAAIPLSVKVLDISQMPVYGDTVIWSVITGGGSFSSPTSTTNTSGIAQVLYTYPTALGQNTLCATESIGGLFTYFTETSVPGLVNLAESIVSVTLSTITAGGSLLATLQTFDAYGNPSPAGITSASLIKIAGIGSGTFTQLGGVNGVYTATFGGTLAGTISIGGLVNGSSVGSPVAVVTVLPGNVVLADTTLTVSSSTVSIGSFITATMIAYDAYGNTNPFGVTGGGLILTPGTGNGVLTQVSSVGGIYIATFGGTSLGTVSISGDINGISTGIPSVVVTVIPGPATSLSIQTCPTLVTAGSAQSINVIAKDIDNNIATGYAGTVSLSSNDIQAVFAPSVSQTATTGGTLNFFVTLETATNGGATFTARDSVHNLIVTCGGITVVPGNVVLADSTLTVSSSTVTAGSFITATLTTFDAYGNPSPAGIASASLILTLGTGNGVLGQLGGVNGVYTATFGGTVVGTVSIGGLINGSSLGIPVDVVTVIPGPAMSLAIQTCPISVTAGNVQNIAVIAKDIDNNIATGYTGTVAMSSNDPLAIFSPSVSQTATTGGTLNFSVTLETATTGGATFTVRDSADNFTVTCGGITVVPGNVSLANSILTMSSYTVSAGSFVTATMTTYDAYGNPSPAGITSASLTLIAGTGDGVLAQLGGVNGVYTATFGGTLAGTVSIGGLINGSSIGIPVDVVTVIPGPVVIADSTVTVTSFLVAVGSSITATLTAYDAYGNQNPSGVSSGSLLLIPSPGNGILAQLGGSNGVYTATFGGTAIGTVTIGGLINGISTGIPVDVIVVVPGTATVLDIQTCPSVVTAGSAQNFDVIAKDSAGDIVTAYSGTITLSSNDALAIFSPSTSQTVTTGGTVAFSVTLETATTGGATFTARDNTYGLTVTCGGITVLPGPAVLADTTLTVSSAIVSAGNFITVTMTAYDIYGNKTSSGITSASFPLTPITGNGVLTQVSSVGGVYTATFGGTLVGTVSIGGLINGSSVATPIIVTVVPGTASSLSIQTCPTTVTAGNAQSFAVIAKDIDNNIATGYTGTVGMSSNDIHAVFSPSVSQTATTGGTLGFSVTLETATTGGATFTALDSAHNFTVTCGGITVVPGPVVIADTTLTVSAFTVSAGSFITATLTAYDAYGNTNPSGITSGSLTLTPGTGNGILTQVSSVGGVYTATFGGVLVGTVSIGGLINGSSVGIPVDVVTVVPGTASSLAIQTCPTTLTAGSAQSINVIAKDIDNNIATGYTGTVGMSSNDIHAVFSPSVSQTATTGGTLGFSVTLETATTGGATFTARDSADNLTVTCGGITVVPGPFILADTTLTVSAFTVSAGSFITATMIAHDAYGNTNPSGITSGSLTLTPGTGNGILTQVSSIGGVYTATFGGTLAGTVSIGGLINGSSVGIPVDVVTVIPGPVVLADTTLTVSSSSVSAGNFITATMTAHDAYGNTNPSGITSGGLTLTLGTGTGTLTQVSSVGGVYTATFGGVLIGTVSIGGLINGSSTGIPVDVVTVVPGTATSLVIQTCPTTVTAGNIQSISVIAKDIDNNIATGYTGTVGMSSNDAKAVFSPSVSQTATTGGTLNFSVTLETATTGGTGGATFTARDSVHNLTVTCGGITVLPGLPTSIAITAPSMASKGGAFSAVVTAYDAYGNVATEDVSSVTMTSNDGAGVITPSSGAVLIAGTKTFSVTLNTATVGKTAILTATSGGLTATAGGIAVSFVTNVVYDTATQANYSVSPAGVSDFTASSVELSLLSSNTMIDNSYIAAGFAGATLNSVTWGGASTQSAIFLTGTPTTVSFAGVNAYQGTLKSRTYQWSQSSSTSAGGVYLSWQTTLPFTKELPATSELSTAYALVPASLMSGVMGIWHMDETAGPTLSDSSGNARTITPIVSTGGSISYGQPGLLGNAVSMTKVYSSGVSCTSCGGMSVVTISAWIYLSSYPATDMSIVSIDNTNLESAGTAAIDMYYYTSTKGITCNAKTSSGTWGSIATLPLGWSHIACVYSTGSGGVVDLYLNGVLHQSGVTSEGTMTVPASPKIYIGKSDLPVTGVLDEVAVWPGQALSTATILTLYRRGANQLGFQVRACADASCSANPSFVGPDGTSSTYYTELENTSPQAYPTASSATVLTTVPSMLFNKFATIPENTYVQYQATFTTLDRTGTKCTYNGSSTWCSPELQAVTIGGFTYDTGAHDTVTTLTGVVTLSSPVAMLTGFSDTESCSTGGVLYNLSTNGSTWYYWNGAAWVTNPTGTLANANSASVVNTNISSFTTSGSLYIKAFLESNGLTTCTLSNVQIQGYE